MDIIFLRKSIQNVRNIIQFFIEDLNSFFFQKVRPTLR